MNDLPKGLKMGADGRIRCWWCGDDPLYQNYHDHEWGRPGDNEVRLFEKICLEGFQSGLSWLTILRKRENFRTAFAGFDVHRIAEFTEADVQRLMADTGIIRNRQKILATITNARAVCAMYDRGESLVEFFRSRLPPPEERPAVMTYDALLSRSQTDTSRRISQDLKQRGFTFVGPVTMYAHMQAMGMVNDHIQGCWVADQSSEPSNDRS